MIIFINLYLWLFLKNELQNQNQNLEKQIGNVKHIGEVRKRSKIFIKR